LSTTYRPSRLILTAGPSITDLEVEYVTDAVQHGWNERWNEYLVKFETSLAEYVGVRYAMATSSATGALHLGLLALGVGPGDEVIVPGQTWVASASTVAYCGAKPVFVDVDRETWTLDPERLEAVITPRTKAIMPVHLYGNPSDMDPICEIAARHGLRIIEDAAPSLGASYRGRRTGSLGDVAAFSFQGAKIAATGEGGMLVTDDPEVYDRAHRLNEHGRLSTSFLIGEIGFKYKMPNIVAALGLAQLERIEELVAKKRQIFGWYRDRLGDVEGLQMNHEREGDRNIQWMSSLVLNGKFAVDRDGLMAGLKERLVDTRPFFPSIPDMPVFEDTSVSLPVSEHLAASAVNLPSGHNLTEEQVDYIARMVCEVIGAA